MLIKDILAKNKDNQQIALIFKDKQYSYKNIYDRVISHKKSIDDLKCNNIGIFIENSDEYVVGYFLISFLDKIIVPMESTSKEEQILSTIRYCELNLIITNDNNISYLYNILKNRAEHDIVIYNISDGCSKVISVGKKKEIILEKILGDDTDVAIMLHTSGTTSDPKKVMLTHRNLVTNIRSNIESLSLTKDDRCLIVLPMCFGYCNTSQFLTHFYLGASIVISEGTFMPQRFFFNLEKYKCTNTTCIPSMLYLIVKSKKRNYILPAFRYLCFGGGTIGLDVLSDIIDILPNVGIVQTYGQTEASPRITCLLPKDCKRKLGSVGKAIPGVSVKVVDEQSKEVLPGVKGEIIVKGENVMKGYYKKPKETAIVIKDGWLHTGDIGMYDEDGFLYIVGRIKNIIISGGLNIYPEEIEEVLRSIPDVVEAVVLPKNHEMLGEIPVAKVVLKDNSEISQSDILNYCRNKLEVHKVPSEIAIVDKIEKTYNGKVRRIK